MTEGPNGALDESRFERVYADIKRLDQLRIADRDSAKDVDAERTARLDQRMDAQDKAVTAALTAAKEAVNAALSASDKANDKAERAQRVVNDTQNEFRGSLKDQAATLMPRAEAENLFREMRGLIAAQGATITDLRSRLDVGPPSLGVLQARSDTAAGRSQGIQLTTNQILAFIGAGGALYLVLHATGHA